MKTLILLLFITVTLFLPAALPGPKSVAAQAPQSYPLVCRGSSEVSVRSRPGRKLILTFKKGTRPASAGLAPGECSWVDRGMSQAEPDTLVHQIKDGGDTDPEYRWTETLSRPDRYWTFDVYSDGERLIVTGSRPSEALQPRSGNLTPNAPKPDSQRSGVTPAVRMPNPRLADAGEPTAPRRTEPKDERPGVLGPGRVGEIPGGFIERDKRINWQLANPYSIAINPAIDAWHAGRVNDVLVNKGGGVIAAADTGGVWVLHSTGAAYSVSQTWDNPDVECLAFGPDDENHIYAGCTMAASPGATAALYETDISKKLPLVQPWKELSVPGGAGGVHQIAVLKKARVIVLACDGGVFWSNIPAPGGTYNWEQATGLPAGPFFGVAEGPKNTVVASGWRADLASGRYGIFYGTFVPRDIKTSELSMRRASIKGFDEKLMSTTSVASCQSQLNNLYALSMDAKGTPNAVLRSIDGGKTWNVTGAALDYTKTDAGPQTITNVNLVGNAASGGWVHRISVSPGNPELVAFGLLQAYYSTDGGSSWKILGGWDWGKHPSLHADVHAVCFDPNDETGQRMFVASDGGVAVTSDLGKTVVGSYNEKLANLQWYSTFVTRNFYGRFDVSYQVPGLIGGGLQDNGNAYALVEPEASPWRRLDGGDGGAGMFLRTGNFLRANMNSAVMWNSTWDAIKAELVGRDAVPVRDRFKSTPDWTPVGLQCDNVNSPAFRNAAGQLMYTVAGLRGKIFGLFANANGTDLHWELVAAWPAPFDQSIHSIASASGKQIYVAIGGPAGTVGPKGVQVLRVTPSLGAMDGFTLGTVEWLGGLPSELEIKPGVDPSPFVISRLLAESDSVLYGLYNSYSTRIGAVLRSDDGGETWRKLPGLPDEAFYGIETDWTTAPKTIFVCSDKRVYVSRNGGKTWAVAARGLPERPHCADLSFVINPDGRRYLYLSTYGWSVWRAALE
jgi:hypothetical protein